MMSTWETNNCNTDIETMKSDSEIWSVNKV